MLHNNEYHAMCDLSRKVREMVNSFLAKDETFARIQGYIKLANDNIERIEKQVKNNNSFYEHCNLKEFYFNKSSLLTSSYEIELYYKDTNNNGKFSHFGVDTLIMLLAECELIKD